MTDGVLIKATGLVPGRCSDHLQEHLFAKTLAKPKEEQTARIVPGRLSNLSLAQQEFTTESAGCQQCQCFCIHAHASAGLSRYTLDTAMPT